VIIVLSTVSNLI